MSLKMSRGEGVTVITITSNPNSKWPILCQILGALCFSPVCAVSQHVKPKMMGIFMALGIVQIAVGILYILTENLFVEHMLPTYNNAISCGPLWIDGVFPVVGIISIVAAWFPNSFLLLIAVGLNIVSTVLAVIDLALYTCDLSMVLNREYRNMMIHGALDVVMMIFLVLQFCVTLSFAVLAVKSFDMNVNAKSVEDPQLYKPLKEEVTVSHVC